MHQGLKTLTPENHLLKSDSKCRALCLRNVHKKFTKNNMPKCELCRFTDETPWRIGSQSVASSPIPHNGLGCLGRRTVFGQARHPFFKIALPRNPTYQNSTILKVCAAFLFYISPGCFLQNASLIFIRSGSPRPSSFCLCFHKKKHNKSNPLSRPLWHFFCSGQVSGRPDRSGIHTLCHYNVQHC
jgi:hypothetical protein